tara:strand:- start:493 stop:741 length:249 start_codon:yes stop_codon:yes gene_type:complete
MIEIVQIEPTPLSEKMRRIKLLLDTAMAMINEEDCEITIFQIPSEITGVFERKKEMELLRMNHGINTRILAKWIGENETKIE